MDLAFLGNASNILGNRKEMLASLPGFGFDDVPDAGTSVDPLVSVQGSLVPQITD